MKLGFNLLLWTTHASEEMAPTLRSLREAGYDGVEVMVTTDTKTRSPEKLLELSERYQQPIMAIHAPVVLLTTFVWGRDPFVKLDRSAALAVAVGAPAVVVHPPFRWQRDYARGFREGVRRLANETDIRFAVENMFPLRVRGREISAYQPSWDVATDEPYRDYTLDLSHAAVSQSDALVMLEKMGDRLAHLHVADGTGLPKDEHLVPGRGSQPCAEVLDALVLGGFAGSVVVEISTRRMTAEQREMALVESLVFCRLHLASALEVGEDA